MLVTVIDPALVNDRISWINY